MTETFASGGTAEREKPVYICTTAAKLGTAVAFDLRHYGFKARTFVSTEVMANAARSAPPGTFILDSNLFGDTPDTWGEVETLRAIAPVIFLSERDDLQTRLNAARAGGLAFLTRPVSLMTLIHELRRAQHHGGGHGNHVALVTATGSALAAYAAELREAGYQCGDCPPGQLLDSLRESTPQLILLDADMTDYPAASLLRVIRQVHALSVVPVILCTSANKRALDGLVAAEGAEGTLGLPVDTADLDAIIRGRIRRAETLEETYRFMAHRDPATGLQTADHFVESLSHGVATGAFERGHAALVLIELDTPETVPLHPLLVRAAEIMRRRLPPFSTAACLDDGTLAAAFNVSSEPEIESVVAALRKDMAALDGIGQAGPRIGVAVLDNTTTSVDATLRAARATDPQSAPGTTGQPSKDLGNFWTRRVTEALRDNRFRLVYQPISSLNDRPCSLHEVFVRLLDKDDSDILPQEFLPAVRRSGLSGRLDRWIISRAIHVLAEHAGQRDRPHLFVKVFPESLAEANLAAWIVDQTRLAGLAPGRLIIEIPQRAAVTRATQTAAFCDVLNDAGFGVAIENYMPDDSGPSLLARLSPTYIKLAAQISDSAHLDRDSQARMAEATSHARELGIATIAAQVQDAEVLSVLWQSGVEYIQGYFMQEPADVFPADGGSNR